MSIQPATSHWKRLQQGELWRLVTTSFENPTQKDIKIVKKQYCANNLKKTIASAVGFKTLTRACRPKLGTDPIMWFPMTNRIVTRRQNNSLLELFHNNPHQNAFYNMFTHALTTVNTTPSNRWPSLIFFKPLTHSKPKSTSKIQQLRNKWPTLCRLLAELDYHQHPGSDYPAIH
ncbi:hypothetical protein BDC45DRAFT_529989 [Circinella umbellata]|nr:hypothetical protein BDC45DRAFT_529989 [Circinella umbellata]